MTDQLRWKSDERGSWQAGSACDAPVGLYYWQISVCEDGTFSVAQSDTELQPRRETFATLIEAQLWCQLMEIGTDEARK